MKTVATFWRPEDAHLLRLRLGEAGIPAFLQDEYSTQIHPWRAAALGGVRVQVPEADFEAARKLTSESAQEAARGAQSGDTDALECCACETSMEPEQTRCPACGWSYEDGEEHRGLADR
jgi:hypothetical protein